MKLAMKLQVARWRLNELGCYLSSDLDFQGSQNFLLKQPVTQTVFLTGLLKLFSWGLDQGLVVHGGTLVHVGTLV